MKQTNEQVDKTFRKGIWKKPTNIGKGTWQTLVLIVFVCLFVCLFFAQCSSVYSDIRGIRKRHPFSYAVQLTWKDQWLIHSAAWHVFYWFTLSYFISWNWVSCVYIERISIHTCDVSSATGVAQLMYMYMYIREHDQAWAYVVYSSPVTHAYRGDMQA